MCQNDSASGTGGGGGFGRGEFCGENHLEEMLLDQAQASYTPLFCTLLPSNPLLNHHFTTENDPPIIFLDFDPPPPPSPGYPVTPFAGEGGGGGGGVKTSLRIVAAMCVCTWVLQNFFLVYGPPNPWQGSRVLTQGNPIWPLANEDCFHAD